MTLQLGGLPLRLSLLQVGGDDLLSLTPIFLKKVATTVCH